MIGWLSPAASRWSVVRTPPPRPGAGQVPQCNLKPESFWGVCLRATRSFGSIRLWDHRRGEQSVPEYRRAGLPKPTPVYGPPWKSQGQTWNVVVCVNSAAEARGERPAGALKGRPEHRAGLKAAQFPLRAELLGRRCWTFLVSIEEAKVWL